jgi:hypothetical protein
VRLPTSPSPTLGILDVHAYIFVQQRPPWISTNQGRFHPQFVERADRMIATIRAVSDREVVMAATAAPAARPHRRP